MIKLKLYPPSGTIEDAKALKFEVSGVEAGSIRIHIENATHGTPATVSSLKNMKDGTYLGVANIKMPAHLSHSMISIFAHIEEEQADGSYKTIQICPTIFTIENSVEGVSDRLSVFPSFIGPEDLCSIRVAGKPKSKKVVSVNDKFFRTIINDEGLGSVSFKGVDVIGSENIETVQQLPIYLYNEEDNFTRKVFSDSYLSVLPSSLAMHADIDPRCTPGDPDYVTPPWVQPEDCEDDGGGGGEGPGITIPPNGLPTTCRKETVEINHQKTCRIFGHSATLLNNGMVMHAYLSPDKTVTDSADNTFNINKVFLAKQQTSLNAQMIAKRDVVVEPKVLGENITIHVQEDVWMVMDGLDNTSASDIYVVLFNAATGLQRIKVIDRDIDPYTGSFTLTGEIEEDALIISDWVFCINAVFYHEGETPDLNLDVVDNPIDLPFITDDEGLAMQVINVSIASNVHYVGLYEESFVYVIAEALDGNKSHLFFNSVSLGKDNSVPTFINVWTKLTSSGNNSNPISKIGSDNNLHVLWESDRAGIKQIYYGVLGMSAIASACTAFSSSLDKYSEFLSKSEAPFDYLSANLLTPVDLTTYDPSYQIPEYTDLVNSSWDIYGYDGSVDQSSGSSYINDLTITANALTEDAMAFNSLQIVEDSENPSAYEFFPYLQFNYQIAFDMEATVSQTSRLASVYDGTIIDDREMEGIFEGWKAEFIPSTDANVNGQPVYTKSSNSFVIGRTDSIFDRVVPIVGSYKQDSDNPSGDRFQIDITDQSNNLKDFTFGLMFEKTRFNATNVYTSEEFATDNPSDIEYIASETHTIYTGMAKLVAFIKTEDVDIDRANYIIVREFPEKINVIDSKTYTIISNYTKMDSLEASTLLDTYEQTYADKFSGQVTLLIDGIARFSQSFVYTI